MQELRVLIADDETISRNGIRDFFDWPALGMKVVYCAENGKQAFEYIRHHPVELVITDIRMPVMDGLTLLEHISNENYPILAIVVSAYNEHEYVMRALRSHVVYDYILKPLDTEVCEDTFARLGGYYRSRYHGTSASSEPKKQVSVLNREQRHISKTVKDILQLIRSQEHTQLPDAVNELLLPYAQDLTTAADIVAELVSHMGFLLDEMGYRRGADFDRMKMRNEIRLARDLDELGDLCIDYAYRCMSRFAPPDQSSTLSPVVRAAIELGKKRYSDSTLSITSLAQEIYVTPNYLSRCFRAETGVRFTRWLNDLRMEQAKQLLASPRFCVYEVSNLVGIDSSKYFTKLFREYTGMTPSEYKSCKEGVF